MKINVVFFKENGKFSHDEVLEDVLPNIPIWETNTIIAFIEDKYKTDMDYVFSAVETEGEENRINVRLVARKLIARIEELDSYISDMHD